jgi:chromosome segregation ATPase
MAAEAAGQLARLGKASEVIGRLRLEHGEKLAALRTLEAKKAVLAEAIGRAGSGLAATTESLRQAERMRAETSAALAKAAADFHESLVTVSCRRLELEAVRTRVAALKDQMKSRGQVAEDLRLRVTAAAAKRAAASRELAEERSRTDALAARIAELERALPVRSIKAEILMRRLQERAARFEEQIKLPAKPEYAFDPWTAAPAQSAEVRRPAAPGFAALGPLALAASDQSAQGGSLPAPRERAGAFREIFAEPALAASA